MLSAKSLALTESKHRYDFGDQVVVEDQIMAEQHIVSADSHVMEPANLEFVKLPGARYTSPS